MDSDMLGVSNILSKWPEAVLHSVQPRILVFRCFKVHWKFLPIALLRGSFGIWMWKDECQDHFLMAMIQIWPKRWYLNETFWIEMERGGVHARKNNSHTHLKYSIIFLWWCKEAIVVLGFRTATCWVFQKWWERWCPLAQVAVFEEDSWGDCW